MHYLAGPIARKRRAIDVRFFEASALLKAVRVCTLKKDRLQLSKDRLSDGDIPLI